MTKSTKGGNHSGSNIAKSKPGKVSKNWKALKAQLETDSNKKVTSKLTISKKNAIFKQISQAVASNDSKNGMHAWFDDSQDEEKDVEETLVKSQSFDGLTKCIAMDCEMVGVGETGQDSILARISLVNQFGKCVYDKFVKPTEEVVDYRTWVSGVRPSDLENAEDFKTVQKEVADILQGRILVGHALWNDLKVLYLSHPKKHIRDTAKYRPFKTMCGGRSPALRVLCKKLLTIQMQKGEHSSVTDAQAAMRLYTMHKRIGKQTKRLFTWVRKRRRTSQRVIIPIRHRRQQQRDSFYS